MDRKLHVFLLTALFRFSYFSRVYADVIYAAGTEPEHAGNDVPLYLLFFLLNLIYPVQLIARGMMLKKRGISGWKILIPFYSRWLEFKTYWKPVFFWINSGISVLVCIILAVIYYSNNDIVIGMTGLLLIAVSAVFVINVTLLRMNTMKIFGFNKWLGLFGTLGMGFIPDFICGFSRSGRIKKEQPPSIQEPVEDLGKWE